MTYKGSFEDGFRQGQGILTWPNGDKYEGDFNQSKILLNICGKIKNHLWETVVL